MMQLGIFAPDIGKLWQQAGYLSSFETAVLAAPFAIWFAGASEGIFRTALKCAEVIARKAIRQPTEESVKGLSKEYKVTKGCVALTLVSLIPLITKTIPYAGVILRIPAYYIAIQVYREITDQTYEYNAFQDALKSAERHVITANAYKLADRVIGLNNDEELDALTDTLLEQLKRGVTVSQKDLDEKDKLLKATLIYQNYCYTGAYLAVKSTYKTSVKLLETGYRIARHIFSLGLFKRTVKFAAEEVKNECTAIFSIPQLPLKSGVS